MSLGSTIALIKTLAGGGGGGGTNVVANPTLAGTEADLTGLQVGDTKYKVGGGVLVVTMTIDEGLGTATLDKTWQEISDADFAVIKYDDEGTISSFLIAEIIAIESIEIESYELTVFKVGDSYESALHFAAATANDYPVANAAD